MGLLDFLYSLSPTSPEVRNWMAARDAQATGTPAAAPMAPSGGTDLSSIQSLSPWLSQRDATATFDSAAPRMWTPDANEAAALPFSLGYSPGAVAAPAGATGAAPALPPPIEIARPTGMLPPGAEDPAALPANATLATGPMPFSLSGGMPQSPSVGAPAASAPRSLPQGSLLDRIGQGINDNSGMLLALGAGLAGAPTLGEGLSKGFQLAAAGGETDRKRRTENATAAFLQRKGYSLEEASAIAQNPAVMQSVLGSMFGKNTDDITEYKFAVQQGYKGSLADWMAQKRGGAGEYGLTPIWGTDAQGNPVLIQPGKSGTAIQTKIPEGVKISAGIEKVDLGTQWALQDKKTGAIVGYLPKDIQGKEAAEERGKAQGQAQVALPAAEASANQALKTIEQIRAHPGKDSVFALGAGGWIPGIPGTSQSDFVALVDQLKGRTFLEAYNQLRGAGAITEVEGKKAEEAIGRLGRTQSREGFEQSLKDLDEVIRMGAQRARGRAAGAPGTTGAPTGSATAQPAAPGLSGATQDDLLAEARRRGLVQ